MTTTDPHAACAESGQNEAEQWIKDGGFILIIIGLLQMFWALAHVCDHYFVTSLRILCEEWKIPDNVAGATIMGIGTSAADIMISVLALFVSHSTLGLGTIIGSELFNHLVICAGSVMAAKNGHMRLHGRTLTRDCFFYLLSLLSTIWLVSGASFHDQSKWSQCLEVNWYHGFVLLCFYIIYALVAIYYVPISNKLFGKETIPLLPRGYSYQIDVGENNNSKNDVNAIALASQRKNRQDAMEDVLDQFDIEEVPPILYRSSATMQTFELVWRYATLPLHLMIYHTIPDMTLERNRKRFVWAAFLSVCWLGAIAECMIVMLELMGALLGIKPTLMGITISAAGASMPTLWSSIVVARQGYGDMAISNALGANTFSIFVGIGLPYFLYPLYTGKPYDGIQDGGILPLLLILIICLVVFYIITWFNDFRLYYWMGYLYLGMYFCVITFVLCIKLVISPTD